MSYPDQRTRRCNHNDEEIDLEAGTTPLGWLCDPETLYQRSMEWDRRPGAIRISVTTWLGS